jgi:F-type H+-transporting ATPase subunit gamma
MAGAGVREFKRRIRSIQSTQQITKAMKMVAAAKLRRAQEKAESSRPYTETLKNTMANLADIAADVQNPLLEVHDQVKRVAYVLVTADGGLCGAYNTNLIKKTEEIMAAETREVEQVVVAVGSKGRNYFKKRDLIDAEYVHLGDSFSYMDTKAIADYIIESYKTSRFDEVYVIYAKFVNVLRQVPTSTRILPVEAPEAAGTDSAKPDTNDGKGVPYYAMEYLYEPSAEFILSALIPRYIGSLVYNAMLEGKASELGARMTAMSSATENAGDMISSLTLAMNKVRQAAITDEILDIVGGAEALKS